jgi:hypothetical protein
VQDRDGALPVLAEARRLFPFIERIFADGAYQGPATAAAVRALGCWELEILGLDPRTGGPTAGAASSRCPSAGSSSAPSAG